MREPTDFLAKLSVRIPGIVIIPRDREAIEASTIVTASGPQTHSLRQAHFGKRTETNAPIIVEDRFVIIIVNARLGFETSLGHWTKQVIGAGSKPFGGAVQVLEALGRGNEVLVIVTCRENDFI